MSYLNYADGYEQGRRDMSSLTGERTFVIPVLSLVLSVVAAALGIACKLASLMGWFIIKLMIRLKKRAALRNGSL